MKDTKMKDFETALDNCKTKPSYITEAMAEEDRKALKEKYLSIYRDIKAWDLINKTRSKMVDMSI